MSEATPFTIGSDASCTDGICGEVSRVVVDPVARTVTHLVVEPKHFHGSGRLVPLDLVDATTGEIRLRCTLADFEELDPAEETQFLPDTPGYPGYDPDQVMAMPYYGMGMGRPTSRRPSPTTLFRWTRWRCAVASTCMPLTATSGESKGWSSTLAIT